MQAWNAELYDRKHAFVFARGAELVGLLNAQPGERILDIGAGTGHLTKKIAEAGARVVGLDNSPEMIARARELFPELEFVEADARAFTFAEPFDAVFTNAVLHWIVPPERVIDCVYRALRPGGRFVGEFGGQGNVRQMIAALDASLAELGHRPEPPPCFFPSLGSYARLLEEAHFRVTYAAHFDRDTALEEGEEGVANWVRMFRAGVLAEVPEAEHEKLFALMKERLRPTLFRDGTWYADYKRLRFVALKT